MERRPYIPENVNFRKPKQSHLQKPKSPVQDNHRSRRKIEQRTSRLENRNADKNSHGTGARIPHHQTAWRGIVPQITQDADNEQQDQIGKASRHAADIVDHIDGHQRNNRKGSGEPVHAVRAVRDIDGAPDQNHGKNTEQHRGNRHLDPQCRNLYGIGIKIQKGSRKHHGYDQIQEPFFVLAPGMRRSVIHIAGEHLCRYQNQINADFPLKGHKNQGRRGKNQDKDNSGAPWLAR